MYMLQHLYTLVICSRDVGKPHHMSASCWAGPTSDTVRPHVCGRFGGFLLVGISARAYCVQSQLCSRISGTVLCGMCCAV